MSDIFISYSQEEKTFVADLHKGFLEHSQLVWVDWELMIPSVTCWDEIKQGITATKHFIIVVSPHSMSSPLCHLEIEYAQYLDKHIIPILYADYERATCLNGITQQLSMYRHLWGTRQSEQVFDINQQILVSANYFNFTSSDNFTDKFMQLMEIIRTNHGHLETNKGQPTLFLNESQNVQKKQRNKRFAFRGRTLFFIFLVGYLGVRAFTNSQDIEAYNRGVNYVNSGNYDQALVAFDEAIRLNPQLAEAYLNRGVVYDYLGDYDQAFADANEAIRLNPQLAEAYMNRGVVYGYLGNYDQAFADANQAIRLNPQLAEAYVNRANAYFYLGEYDQALEDANQAIRLNPRLAQAYVNRALVYANLGEYDQALADANEAIRLNPQIAEAYMNRATAYFYLGEYDQALADANEAIRLNPQFAQAYGNRATAYFYLGEYDQALVDANEAIRLNPQFAEVYALRAAIYGNLGEYDQALMDANEAIRLNPQLIEAYGNRAVVYMNLRDYDQALADSNEVIRLNPQLPQAYLNRGIVYILLYSADTTSITALEYAQNGVTDLRRAESMGLELSEALLLNVIELEAMLTQIIPTK